jgi:glycosyltransferase involved in cell wall biosynthesis
MGNPFNREQGKFSLIIPVYKTAKFLPNNIEHLFRQDYKNYEVIIVFDGADKKGEQIVKDLIKKYPKMDIRYDVIKHGGAPKARNRGVELATGDFYSFLDADSYFYAGTLREWATLFELNPHVNRVWGLYDLNSDGMPIPLGGGIVTDNKYVPDYWAFRFANYCSGTNPVRKEAFVGWDESLKSLQDWDLNIRMLKKDNFQGKDWLYVPKPYFITEQTRKGSISLDAVTHFLEREKTVLEKNDIPISDTCFCSYAAQYHGVNLAKICEYDYHHHPQYMPFEYKRLIQVGFFTGTNEQVQGSYSLFQECIDSSDFEKKLGRFKGKKIIMWIGTDIWQMRNNASFEALKARKKTWESEGWISVVGDQNAHDKLKELGFDSKIIYYPPHHFYKPMPLPKEVAVGVYESEGDNNFKYHNEAIYELAKKYPKVKFYFYGDESKKGQKKDNIEHLGWVKMDEWMPKFTMHIELTLTGGIGSGGVEYLMAGRQVITDVDEPYTFKADRSLESIEKAFKMALKKPFDQEEMSDFYNKRHDKKNFKREMDKL